MTKVKLYNIPTDRVITFYVSKDLTTKEELKELLVEYNQEKNDWIVLNLKQINTLSKYLIKAILKSTTDIEDVICHCYKCFIV